MPMRLSKFALAIASRMPQRFVDLLYRNRRYRIIRIGRELGAKWLGDTAEGVEIVRGPLSGFRFAFTDSVAMWIGGHETAVTDTVERMLRPGMTAIDIGAHVGYTVLLMSQQVGPSGRVIGFEPDPVNFELLVKNIKMNELGSFVEPKMLALGINKGSGALQRGSLSGLTKIERSRGGDVEISTLDAEVLEGRVPVPHFMVIDAEGAEEDILRGGWRVLEKHGPMVLVEDHGRREALVALLSRVGYRGERIDAGHVLFTKHP